MRQSGCRLTRKLRCRPTRRPGLLLRGLPHAITTGSRARHRCGVACPEARVPASCKPGVVRMLLDRSLRQVFILAGTTYEAIALRLDLDIAYHRHCSSPDNSSPLSFWCVTSAASMGVWASSASLQVEPPTCELVSPRESTRRSSKVAVLFGTCAPSLHRRRLTQGYRCSRLLTLLSPD